MLTNRPLTRRQIPRLQPLPAGLRPSRRRDIIVVDKPTGLLTSVPSEKSRAQLTYFPTTSAGCREIEDRIFICTADRRLRASHFRQEREASCVQASGKTPEHISRHPWPREKQAEISLSGGSPGARFLHDAGFRKPADPHGLQSARGPKS